MAGEPESTGQYRAEEVARQFVAVRESLRRAACSSRALGS